MALEAIRGELTLSELATRFDAHPNQVTQWKAQLLEQSAQVFAHGIKTQPEAELQELHAKIGRQALEIDFLGSALSKAGKLDAKAMIDRNHKLPVTKQAEALGISRSTLYYQPAATPTSEFDLMRRMDELHLPYPFTGSRMLRELLVREGVEVGRRRVGRLMRKMGICALYRKSSTSRAHPDNPVYPYLLRGMPISRPNQVWAMDITSIPMAKGFVYLAAVEDAIGRYRCPDILNTRPG